MEISPRIGGIERPLSDCGILLVCFFVFEKYKTNNHNITPLITTCLINSTLYDCTVKALIETRSIY